MIFPTAGECVNCGHRDHMVYVTAGQPAEYLGCLADGCQCQDYVAVQDARPTAALREAEGYVVAEIVGDVDGQPEVAA